MAHVKGAGTTKLGRDSESKRLGIKVTDGQTIKAGGIIIRQRGLKFRPGQNVGRGKDDTLFALSNGIVKFTKKVVKKFTGTSQKVTFVNVSEKAK